MTDMTPEQAKFEALVNSSPDKFDLSLTHHHLSGEADLYYLNRDTNVAFLAFRAALSANDVESRIHVGFTNAAQIEYAKDESGSFYPDTNNDCYIPLYMLKRHINRMGPDYVRPAPQPQAEIHSYAVIGRDGAIEFSIPLGSDWTDGTAISMCHAHINDAINSGTEGAGSWVVRAITVHSLKPQGGGE